MVYNYSLKTQSVSDAFENILEYTDVVDYKYHHCSPVLEIIAYANSAELNFKTHESSMGEFDNYFIFDCPGEDALGHWIFESFIFFPIFMKLKQKYDNIKIITKNTKKYVRIVFNLFGITCDILHNIPTDSYFQHNIGNVGTKNATLDSECVNKRNRCFFPPVLSLNDNELNQDMFLHFIDNYRNYIIENILTTFKQQNNLLFLPRNSVDNYANNDRRIPFTAEIKDYVINNGGVVLNSYEINNLFIQFHTVYNSDIIILDYGSSYWFNCIFLNNKTIILLSDDVIYFQTNNIISCRILFDIISKNNNVIIVHTGRPDLMQKIQHVIESHNEV
jgi:hypothetical protein